MVNGIDGAPYSVFRLRWYSISDLFLAIGSVIIIFLVFEKISEKCLCGVEFTEDFRGDGSEELNWIQASVWHVQCQARKIYSSTTS